MATITGGRPAAGLANSVSREEFSQFVAMFKKSQEEQTALQKAQDEKIKALMVGSALENAAMRSLYAYSVDADRAIKELQAKNKALMKTGAITALSFAKTSTKVCLVAAKAGEDFVAFKIKKLPVVGAIFGLVLGVVRLVSGDHWVLALGEVASGVASCFPGIGTAISIGIDGCLLANDAVALRNAASQVARPTRQGGINTLAEAYGCLGIKPEEGEPTKAQVDKLYRELQLQYHPDIADKSDLGEAIKLKFVNFSACLTAAKDFIYKEHRW